MCRYILFNIGTNVQELVSFVMIITLMATAIGISFGIVSLALGSGLIKSIIFVIGIIVANVPEGLLMTVTMSLTLAAQRMAAKNCLVRSLESVEALGSTSVICTDKTGTLTQNKMTVAHMWLNDIIIPITCEEGHYAEGFPKEASGWPQLARVAVLCSRATFVKEDLDKPIMERRCTGDASEAGILKCYETLLGNSEAVRSADPKLAEIPFNSKNKFQVSVHDLEHSGRYLVVLKGAPELVLSRCSTILLDGKEAPIDGAVQERVHDAFLTMASHGERVLAFGDLELDPAEFPPGYNFTTEGQPNFPLDGLRSDEYGTGIYLFYIKLQIPAFISDSYSEPS
jgi:sodium/potassium-transporting ATPase subunit alpha